MEIGPMVNRYSHRPRAMAHRQPVFFVYFGHSRGISPIEYICPHPRGPPPCISSHHGHPARPCRVQLKPRGAITGFSGYGPELRELPFLVQRLAAHAHRHLEKAVRAHRPRHNSFAIFAPSRPVRLIDHGKRRRHDIRALVGTVERTVAMVIKFHAGAHPPRP